MLAVTTVEGGLVTKDDTFREGRLIKLVNQGLWVVFFYMVVIFFYFELTLYFCIWR